MKTLSIVAAAVSLAVLMIASAAFADDHKMDTTRVVHPITRGAVMHHTMMHGMSMHHSMHHHRHHHHHLHTMMKKGM